MFFLIFLGFCLAAFAFMSSYLNALKSFLEHLKTIQCQEKINNFKEAKDKILKFFFVVDLLSWMTLFFLLFSMLSTIAFLVASLYGCEYPYIALRHFLCILTCVYIIIMIFSFINAEKLRKNDWEEKSLKRWLWVYGFLIFGHGVVSLFLSWRGLIWFFVGLLVMIVALLIGFVFALAIYNPLTELGKCWGLLQRDENKK